MVDDGDGEQGYDDGDDDDCGVDDGDDDDDGDDVDCGVDDGDDDDYGDDVDCGVVPGWGHREGQGQAWNILSRRNSAKFYQILALSYNSQLWCKMFFLQ